MSASSCEFDSRPGHQKKDGKLNKPIFDEEDIQNLFGDTKTPEVKIEFQPETKIQPKPIDHCTPKLQPGHDFWSSSYNALKPHPGALPQVQNSFYGEYDSRPKILTSIGKFIGIFFAVFSHFILCYQLTSNHFENQIFL